MTRKIVKTPATPPSVPVAASKRFFPILESIGVAAAHIGVPEALLKAAKRRGCKAFIGSSRVDTAVLIPYLFNMLSANPQIPEGFGSWREVLESERAKREAIKRQVDEKSMMPTVEAEQQAGEAMVFIFAEFDRGERELPPALAGLESVALFVRLKDFFESVRAKAKERFERIGK